jgi:hypothetical protein
MNIVIHDMNVTKNNYLTFKEDTLWNKTTNILFLHENSNLKGEGGGNSNNFCGSVVNLVAYDVVDDQKHIFDVWRNKELIVKKRKT